MKRLGFNDRDIFEAILGYKGIIKKLPALLPLMLYATSGYSATFVVNDTGDDGDAVPGDGIALTAGSVTTLRAAVQEANTAYGPTKIQFDFLNLPYPTVITLESQIEVRSNVTIQGGRAGRLIISGNKTHRMFRSYGNNATFRIDGVTFRNGGDSDEDILFGGAVYIENRYSYVTNCIFENNIATYGGGAIYASDTTAHIDNCRFTGNGGTDERMASGGAIVAENAEVYITKCVFEDNGYMENGGAIYAHFCEVYLQQCDFHSNEGQGSAIYGSAGNIAMRNCLFYENVSRSSLGTAFFNTNSALIVNCIFARNSTAFLGAAIEHGSGTAKILNCTIIDNESNTEEFKRPKIDLRSAGISSSGNTVPEVGNTIVAGNIVHNGSSPDVYGTVSSLGGNLIGVDTGSVGFTGTGDQVGTVENPIDPLMGPFQNNGGPTLTCSPLPGSPAINAGLNSLVTSSVFGNAPFYDQRGAPFARIYESVVDIGALEAQPIPDVFPPVIELIGGEAVLHECGAEYADLGATASDETSGDITGDIQVTGSVDVNAPGNYELTYTVSDEANNTASITRIVTVHDTTPPSIVLNGDAVVTIPCLSEYIDPGAEAYDTCDSALPPVTVDSSGVNTLLAGHYEVTFTVSDVWGNAAEPVKRTVIVEGPCVQERHSADQNGDHRISLTELLRVIQIFNVHGYQCAASPGATEDGYLPGAGEGRMCAAHASDYNPQDWQIGLTELLRLIQFFNTGGYHACLGQNTEDGYCVGPES